MTNMYNKNISASKYKRYFNNKTILITGGTGSFGNAVVEKLLSLNPQEIIIFSRDEKKQFDMGNKFNSPKLRFITGDVRDISAIDYAIHKVDFVFHAAALKQVPNCEFFPMEAIQTNALGAANVIRAAINNNVKRLVVLSTDKAVYPINAMGMTKALMERIMISHSREKKGKTILCGTRYGNVMATRGSVIPYFMNLIRENKPLTVTDPNMTRFMMNLNDSIDLVFHALSSGKNGEIYIKKAPATKVGDLAKAMCAIFSHKKGIKNIGIRPGEKMHETLVSQEECLRTKDQGLYYQITPEAKQQNYKKYYFQGNKANSLPSTGYTSSNAKRLNISEIKKLVLSLDEVKQALKS